MTTLGLIRVSLRTVADFMTSPPSTQRRIVRTNKYPANEEAKAIVAYYRDARAVAERFFESGGQNLVIEDAVRKISGEANIAMPARKARLNQNVRAIRDFQSSTLASRRFQTLKRPCIDLILGSVELRVRPSLCLRDQIGQVHWIFLDFSDGQMDAKRAIIVIQLCLQAVDFQGISLKSMRVVYYHLHSGQNQIGGRHSARLEAQIFASCQTFSDIWASM